jgi:hypothetical protein
METLYNNLIGPFIFFSLLISIILAFILPKTKLSKHLGIGQTYFVITNVCGIVLGAIGIIIIFLLEPNITRRYLWKILIMPYVYMQIYIIYVMIAKRTINIFDEKQDFNMTSGAAISFGAMLVIMGLIISPLIQNKIIGFDLLFPLFINSSIFVYSISTLFLFKKA